MPACLLPQAKALDRKIESPAHEGDEEAQGAVKGSGKSRTSVHRNRAGQAGRRSQDMSRVGREEQEAGKVTPTQRNVADVAK